MQTKPLKGHRKVCRPHPFLRLPLTGFSLPGQEKGCVKSSFTTASRYTEIFKNHGVSVSEPEETDDSDPSEPDSAEESSASVSVITHIAGRTATAS